MDIVYTKDFPDSESGFRKQQDEELIPAVGTRLKDCDNFIVFRRPHVPFFFLQVTFERLKAEPLFYAYRIDCEVVIIGQHLQAPKLFIHSLDIKKEPEHIFQICVAGSVVYYF